MSKWKSTKLDDIAVVMLSNVDKKTNDGERIVKLCNYTDVYKNSYISFDKTESFMIASCNENEFNKFELKRDQVAITKDSEKRDDIGISTYIAEDLENVVLGYHTALITPIENKLSGKFLNYWLNTKLAKEYFENNAGGSGQRCTLPIDIIRAIPIVLPKYDEQLHISSILFNLDTKIELNKRIKVELEQMAKTIYDYWFVQFDFPMSAEYAASVGQPELEGKPYKASGGKMMWSDELKRELPEGWEVKEIETFCRIFTGKKDVNQALETGKYKFYSCSPNYKYSDDKLFEGKAILISGNGSYTGRTIFINEGFDLYQRTYACVNKTEIDILSYLYYTILRFLCVKIGGGTHGSSIPYIVYDDIAKEKFIYKLDLIHRFQEIIYPILLKMKSIENENQKLTELRDWLLPMLMNGQVRVVDDGDEEIVMGMAAEPLGEYKVRGK